MRDPKAPGWPNRGERTEDPAIANRWIWEYYDLVRGEHRRRVLRLPKDRKLSTAVEAYLEHRADVVEKATLNSDRTALNHLLARVPDTTLSSLEPAKVQEMFGRMVREGYKPPTLATYLKCVGTFFRWADYPLPQIELPEPGTADVATLEPHECDALREAALFVDRTRPKDAPSARLAVELGLSMGLRQGEIFALRWEAIDPGTRTARVQWQIPKDGKAPKPLKGKLARTTLIFSEWWPWHRSDATGYVCAGAAGKHVGTRTQRLMITRVLDRAGLKTIGNGFHLLRHTYARHFIERRGRFEDLQLCLGHRSITTTERRYGHYHPEIALGLARATMTGV